MKTKDKEDQAPLALNDFLESCDAPVAFEIEGVKGSLYCKILSIDEASSVMRSVSEPNANVVLTYCAAAVVRHDGTPFADVAKWGRWPIKSQGTLLKIFKACQEINGNLPSDEVVAAGKESAGTPVSA